MKKKLSRADKDKTYAQIGMLLILTQQTENMLRSFFHAIGISGSHSLEITASDKRTLGKLIGELRSKTDIHAHFEEDLLSFLKFRNDFIHNLADQAWFDPDTPLGERHCWAWMGHYQQLMYVVQTVLLTYTQVVEGRLSKDLHQDFNDIRTNPAWDYPSLFQIIRKKESPCN